MTAASRRNLLVLSIAAAVALAAAGSYLVANGRTAREAGKGPAKGRTAVLVSTTVVQPRTFEIYEDVIGTLENVIDPTVGAEVAGRVIRVMGFTGKKVQRGEPLAEIDAQDFQIQARADTAEIKRLQALLENQAGFYGAQMSAMDNATRNAGDLIRKLTLRYNRQRQANITKELIEIISGAEAL